MNTSRRLNVTSRDTIAADNLPRGRDPALITSEESCMSITQSLLSCNNFPMQISSAFQSAAALAPTVLPEPRRSLPRETADSGFLTINATSG
ncbi:hypothetical protein J6590_007935 [Homalodisca vitripennis]|nr:hypothetical protein J6590_007935 [Homalodisca vitripennis]